MPGMASVTQSATHSFFNSPKMSQARDAPNMHNSAMALKNTFLRLNNPSSVPGGGDFVSNTQLAYKWVQPQFVDK